MLRAAILSRAPKHIPKPLIMSLMRHSGHPLVRQLSHHLLNVLRRQLRRLAVLQAAVQMRAGGPQAVQA